MSKVKKAIVGIVALVSALQSDAGTNSYQATPTYKVAASDTLSDRLKDFKKEFRVQYILREQQLTSYARKFEINGKKFIEYYLVIPNVIKAKEGLILPIADETRR